MRSSTQNLYRHLPAVVLLLILLVSGLASGTFRSLEDGAYAVGMELSASRRASERFAVLLLDEHARETVGEWPWSGPDMVRLLAALEDAGVHGIAWNLPPIAQPTEETRTALDALDAQLPDNAEVRTALADLRSRIMPNAALAGAMAGNPGVLLSIPPSAGTGLRSDEADATATLLTRWRLDHVTGDDAPVNIPRDLVAPRMPFAEFLADWREAPAPPRFEPAAVPEALLQAVAAVGLRPAGDDYLRYPLVARVNGQWLPTLPLRMAMLATDRQRESLWLRRGHGAALDGNWIPTSRDGIALPYFYPVEGRDGVQRYSIADVLSGSLPDDALLGRVVLLGADGPTMVRTTRHEQINETIALAQVAASLYSGDVYASPWWAGPTRLLAWLLVAAWLLLALPRMDWRWSALGSMVLAIVLINVELLLLISQSWWLQLAAPVLMLVLGHAVLQVQRWWLDGSDRQQQLLSAANLELGRECRSHGHLDRAFEALRQCEPDETVLEQLNDLAHDYERRQRFAQALKVFRHIKRIAPRTPEVDHRINRLQRLEEQSLKHGKHPINLEPGETRDPLSAPMIGRFSILEEIARGSMGIVYRGQDSRIGREVAVKTLALQNEFSGSNLEEVQARFFREAEAAGRLSHPNIVTIYDVGEEDGLAYIAMDLLKGPALSKYATPDTLLSPVRVLHLAAQVAEALQAAHDQNVIHRDVKPANIVLTSAESEVKVTDFGVAHLADASQTRTGTILGSPSFMSPEQVSGKRLDGRTDLWSLGVSIYQLVTGHLPFTGEPLGTLMYRIANEELTPATDWRPDLPPCISNILEKALQKDPEQRYATGRGMAKALRACAAKLEAGG